MEGIAKGTRGISVGKRFAVGRSAELPFAAVLLISSELDFRFRFLRSCLLAILCLQSRERVYIRNKKKNTKTDYIFSERMKSANKNFSGVIKAPIRAISISEQVLRTPESRKTTKYKLLSNFPV